MCRCPQETWKTCGKKKNTYRRRNLRLTNYLAVGYRLIVARWYSVASLHTVTAPAVTICKPVETELSYRNDRIIVFFIVAKKSMLILFELL